MGDSAFSQQLEKRVSCLEGWRNQTPSDCPKSWLHNPPPGHSTAHEHGLLILSHFWLQLVQNCITQRAGNVERKLLSFSNDRKWNLLVLLLDAFARFNIVNLIERVCNSLKLCLHLFQVWKTKCGDTKKTGNSAELQNSLLKWKYKRGIPTYEQKTTEQNRCTPN